ncbi:alpha-1,6-mannosyl-glycoprotein 2-beta-N-acetylglucosaminyltransferase-like [Primulina eburnea]|uniref:alpha-1,6-mannosyl-glycoprotein 2-beta-N-acetylglucosaminyltransferase-like n=1 Tax=Primulina eburnea TaxID=1245227 RepID=UPI003C6C858D
MAALFRKARVKDASFRREVLIFMLGSFLLVLVLRTNAIVDLINRYTFESDDDSFGSTSDNFTLGFSKNFELPKQNELSILLEDRNQMPPKNIDLYPKLAKNHIVIVLYVHNRPKYLQVVIDSLSHVVGISETLLIVSHDGFFEDMNKIIRSIKFCQVKQIFAPYSPHVFDSSFPGVSPGDCEVKEDPTKIKCKGNPDQYGNHRSPKIVSLKHHWWWMMNTVWDGLRETSQHSGHILFIEEDHFIYPNAYQNLMLLTELKHKKCPLCYAANLAPSDVKVRGERLKILIAERMGNVGYAFNRTVWRKIHRKAREFCSFDDYNWDITMWAAVYPSFGGPVYSLRGPRTSAVHFGKCGLHQGQGQQTACVHDGSVNFEVEEEDRVPNIVSNRGIHVYNNQPGYKAGFRGWGGWGDRRDHELCMQFSKMYVVSGSREV